MSDLVKRLNQMAGEYGAMCGEGELADRAADRIELLEGLLREAMAHAIPADLWNRIDSALTTDSGQDVKGKK
jgi:hypothetical protein